MTAIREMRNSDLDAMLQIRRAWLLSQFSAAETTEQERAWFARYPGNKNAPAFVAEDGERVVGYLLCALTTHPAAVGVLAEIDEVCVAESHRRRGVGSRLVEALRHQLRATVADLTAIRARVDRQNEPGIAFLQALGFEHDVLEFINYFD